MFLMILLISSTILVVYAILSGIVPLKISKWIKLVLALAVIAVGLKYQIYTMNGGTLMQPSVGRGTMIVMETLYGSLIIFVVLLIIKDLTNLILFTLRKLGKYSGKNANSNSIIGLMMLTALIAASVGTYEAVKVPEVKTVGITLKGLNPVWKDFKIVQLSDLHIGPIHRKDWLQQVVDKVNALKPDVVVITGDFVDGPTNELFEELQPFEDIKAKYGIIGIPGNHEYYSGYEAWMNALKMHGITMLQNQNVVLRKDNQQLIIGGTTDFGAYHFGLENPDLKKTFSDTEKAPRILLTHQPKTTYKSSEPFDLQLSGHTHGGHLFFLYPLIGYFNDWLVSGLYQRGEKQIYVSNGTGLWGGFSQRIGVPAEITEIILR